MTNEEIILRTRLDLFREGKIKGTGRTFSVEMNDGSTRTYEEPEPIHTFQYWKESGFSVKKGEHCVAKILIWKAGKGKDKKEAPESGESPARTRMFMKTAFFFSESQVEPIKGT